MAESVPVCTKVMVQSLMSVPSSSTSPRRSTKSLDAVSEYRRKKSLMWCAP